MRKISLLLSIVFLFLYCQTEAQNIIPSRPTTPASQELKKRSCPPGYTWQGTEWKWEKSAETYKWVPGKCLRIKKGHMWIPGEWSRVAKGWIWIPGQWRKI